MTNYFTKKFTKNFTYQVEVGIFDNVARTMKRINLCEYCGKGREFFGDDDVKFKNHSRRNKTEVFCKECEKCFASNLILRRHLESDHKLYKIPQIV